jgi:hypothetical protein
MTDRFTMTETSVVCGGFERMPNGVAEVEHTARSLVGSNRAFSFIPANYARFELTMRFDQTDKPGRRNIILGLG